MNKKALGVPVWAWVVVLAGAAYLYYRHRVTAEGEEALYPTTGPQAPTPAEGEGSAPAGGIAGISQGINELGEAGFVPRGSEEARQEPAFAPPSKLEGLIEEGFGEYLRGLMNPGRPKAHNKAPKQKHKEGKGKKRPANPKRKPKAPNTGHHPGHLATPNHGASKHPRQRISQARPVKQPAPAGHHPAGRPASPPPRHGGTPARPRRRR